MVAKTEYSIKECLAKGTGLEYTRDSPLFRQQLHVFEESFDGLKAYASNIKSALNAMESALNNLTEAQGQLALSLVGKSPEGNPVAGFGNRCLFTNALPDLGNLSDILKNTENTMVNLTKIQSTFTTSLMTEVGSLLDDLSSVDLIGEGKPNSNHDSNIDVTTAAVSAELSYYELKNVMESSCEEYEAKLAGAISTRIPLSPNEESGIIDTRCRYELARFDLVQRLNNLDGRKKYIIAQIASSVFQSFLGFHSSGEMGLKLLQSPFSTLVERIRNASAENSEREAQWLSLRSHLHGELCGAAPPPGAPLGALSPLQPRRHRGMSSFTSLLTLEVLRDATRAATYEEYRHVRDDGIFRQGFLFSRQSNFGGPRRHWYRLYSSKVYRISEALVKTSKGGNGGTSQNSRISLEQDLVCDLTGASISMRSDCDVPFVIEICLATPSVVDSKAGSTSSSAKSGAGNDSRRPPSSWSIFGRKSAAKHIELQAESEADVVEWIRAMRRCATGAKLVRARDPTSRPAIPRGDFPAPPSSTGEIDDATQIISDDVTDSYSAGLSLAPLKLCDALPPREAEALTAFIRHAENSYCAECGMNDVRWVSLSLGVTLCQECAEAHRQLSWTVSKLKHLNLDLFYEWEIDLLRRCLGNRVSNLIWEICISQGWTKPKQNSPMDDKAAFIFAKYRWFAFVDKFSADGPNHLAEGLHEAAVKGDVPQALWWISHGADVTSIFPVEQHEVNEADRESKMSQNRDMHRHRKRGKTPLHYAVELEHMDMVTFLLLNGADPLQPDREGLTAQKLAEEGSGETKRTIAAIIQSVLSGCL
jgi:hypothetical protein